MAATASPEAPSAPQAGGGANISIGSIRGYGRNDPGVFKMSADLFGWKSRRTQTVRQYKASDIVKGEWIKNGASMNQLLLHLNTARGGDEIARFDGFTDKSFPDINRHFEQQFGIKLEKRKLAHKGWHWGEYEVQGKNFFFVIDKKPAFDLAAPDIAQVTNPTKTDLAIEMRADDKLEADEDQLMEVRFYMPPKNDPDETEVQLDGLRQDLISLSGVGETKMDTVALLTDVHLLVPRGRYEIDLGRRALKLHGKSYDYTIQYSNIQRMFLVPRPNSPHVAFVLALENAMRQGQTRYPYVLMQFENETVMSLDVNLGDDELQEQGLAKHMEGKTFNVVTRLFKALVGKAVVVPGDFQNMNGEHGITCSHRAQSGHLFPLNRSFLFIVKPVILIRYDEVVSVEFSRTTAATTTRFFSFTVSLRGGTEYEFTSIDRNEYKPLVDFLQSKDIRVKSQQDAAPARVGALSAAELQSEDDDDDDFDGEDEEESDEEFQSEGEDDEEEAGSEESEDAGDDEASERRGKKRKSKSKKEKKEKKKKSRTSND